MAATDVYNSVDYQDTWKILFYSTESQIALSTDGNQLLNYANPWQLQRWALCEDGTYLSNNQFLNCSSQCNTCSKSENYCTSFQQNQYLQNFQCFQCIVRGCKTCLNLTHCFQCDTSLNFYSKPQKGQCLCAIDYKMNKQQKCIKCTANGCQYCQQTENCTTWQQNKIFSPFPIDNQCVCKQNYQFNVYTSICQCKTYVNSDGNCVKNNGWEAELIILSAVIFVIVLFAVAVYCIKKRRNNIKGNNQENQENEYQKIQQQKNNNLENSQSILTT